MSSAEIITKLKLFMINGSIIIIIIMLIISIIIIVIIIIIIIKIISLLLCQKTVAERKRPLY